MNWVSPILPILTSLGGLVVAGSVLGYICRDRVKSVLMGRLLTLLNTELSKEDKEASFVINTGGKSATITFQHQGKSHKVYVPYDRALLSQPIKRAVITQDGLKEDLNQKSGIPLLVTADQLNVDKIVTIVQPDE